MATPQRRKEPFFETVEREDEFLSDGEWQEKPRRSEPGTRNSKENFRPRIDADEPVMVGTYFHSLDEKARIVIPAKLRPALSDRFWMMLDEHDNVVLVNYATGRDILVYCERLMAHHPEDGFIAAAVERITGSAELVTLENDSYRVAISDVLRCYAGLAREVVTVGLLNKAVLWDRDKWEKAQLKKQGNPEVRQLQAEMMRAAASGSKYPPPGQEREPSGRASGEERITRSSAGFARTQDSSSGNAPRGNDRITVAELGR